MIKVGEKVKVIHWIWEYPRYVPFIEEYATEKQKKKWHRTQNKPYAIRFNKAKNQKFIVKKIERHFLFENEQIAIIENNVYCFLIEIKGLQKVEANAQDTK